MEEVTSSTAVDGLSTAQAARRQRILDATLSLLELRDYERIAVRDITDFASVALATLYHYFPSKEHLFAEALIQWASSLKASVTTRPLTGTTPGRQLEEALLRSVQAFERQPQLARLIGRLEMSDEPFARDVLSRLDTVTTDVYLNLLTDLPRDEAVRIVRIVDAVLDSSLRAWSSGRSSMRDVRRSLSETVALLLPEGSHRDAGVRRRVHAQPA